MVYDEALRKSSLKILLYKEPVVRVQKMSVHDVSFPRTTCPSGADCAGSPRYRVMYTIKYSACDLNDMPEQLCGQTLANVPSRLTAICMSHMGSLHFVKQYENRNQMAKVGYSSQHSSASRTGGGQTIPQGLHQRWFSPEIRKIFMMTMMAGIDPARSLCQC